MTCFGRILLLFLLLSGCSPALNLKAVKAAKTAVESSVTTTTSGTVIAEQQAVLGFGAAGRITRIYISAGDSVKAGQLLAELENADLKTVFANSKQDLDRARELFDSGLISRAALDEARRGHDVARSNLDRSLIKAPFDGVITEMNLEVGGLAQTTTASTKAPIRIVDTKPRRVKGDIDEIDISKVRVGTSARVKIQALGPAWLPAQVSKVIPFVSTLREKDRTSEIELKITDEKGLLPVGASADIEVVIDRKEGALAVPSRVVLGKGGQKYLYRFEGGKIRKVEIKPGLGNYARTEVLSGLSEGDVVIFPPDDTDLKDGMKAAVELQPWP